MQLGVGFLGSKTLLSAIELGLFTELAKGPLDAKALTGRLKLHPRSAVDFFDALVALGMLKRAGTRYANTPETALFLDRAKPSYMGGILEMANARLYRFWGSLTEALQTGKPQNEVKTGEDFFGTLYADPAAARRIFQGHDRPQHRGRARHRQKVSLEEVPLLYRHRLRAGRCGGRDRAVAEASHGRRHGSACRAARCSRLMRSRRVWISGLRFHAGDFFKDPLPKTDVLIMGHILHDWNLDEKMMLLRKAYDALPQGGALIVHEAIIDDARKKNAFGLLMSLNMLIETHGRLRFHRRGLQAVDERSRI